MGKPAGRRDGHLLGVLLVVASALAFSLAGVLTKSIAADAWTIACWRGLLGGMLIALYVAWLGRAKPPRESFRLGWRGWLLACVGSVASLAFIFAFKLTYIANVAVIYATVPFMAAGLAWWLLRERFQRRTAVTTAFSLLGVVILVAGGPASGKLVGDAVALFMTLGNALYMVLIRVFRDSPVVLAGGVSAFQLFLVGWFVVDPLAVSQQDAVLLTLFGISWALAVVLWTEGTRLIPARRGRRRPAFSAPRKRHLRFCSLGCCLQSYRRLQASLAAASSSPLCLHMPPEILHKLVRKADEVGFLDSITDRDYDSGLSPELS